MARALLQPASLLGRRGLLTSWGASSSCPSFSTLASTPHPGGEGLDVVICGAGLSGIACAHFLSQLDPTLKIAVVDSRPPLSFTSSMSTECYRNFWAKPSCHGLIDRSIDLLEDIAVETGNGIAMSRKGYVYLATTEKGAEDLRQLAATVAGYSGDRVRSFSGPNPLTQGYLPDAELAGYFRRRAEGHTGRGDYPLRGIDLLEGNQAVRAVFPYLSEEIRLALHARRCGWISAQQYGIYMKERAEERGVRFLRGEVGQVLKTQGGQISGAVFQDSKTGKAQTLNCKIFINSSGPYLQQTNRMIQAGVKSPLQLPIFNEVHGKVIFRDHLNVVPQSCPMLICADETKMFWSEEEAEELRGSDFPRKDEFLGILPSGYHFRPFGNQTLAMLWEYVHIDTPVSDPPEPEISFDPYYPEIATRGMARIIPGFRQYLQGNQAKAFTDGGYYCKTRTNMPIIDAYPNVPGAYVCGALSGFGVMSSAAAGELTALRILGRTLPSYASDFELSVHLEEERRRKEAGTLGKRHREVQL